MVEVVVDVVVVFAVQRRYFLIVVEAPAGSWAQTVTNASALSAIVRPARRRRRGCGDTVVRVRPEPRVVRCNVVAPVDGPAAAEPTRGLRHAPSRIRRVPECPFPYARVVGANRSRP